MPWTSVEDSPSQTGASLYHLGALTREVSTISYLKSNKSSYMQKDSDRDLAHVFNILVPGSLDWLMRISSASRDKSWIHEARINFPVQAIGLNLQKIFSFLVFSA